MKLPWDIKSSPARTDEKGHRISTHPELYHTYRWHKLAKAFLADHPLCAECRKRGIIKAAEVADHIIPVDVWMAQGGDFYDVSNLQPLCAACNIRKGNRDKEAIRKIKGVGGVKSLAMVEK